MRQILATFTIIFDKDNKVLLTQRNNPNRLAVHGKWQFPGGGIEFGEHPYEALLREMDEELNIKIETLTERPFIYNQVYVRDTYETQIIMLVYPAKYVSGTIDISKDPETGGYKWFSYDEVAFDQCLPNTRELLDKAYKYLESESTK